MDFKFNYIMDIELATNEKVELATGISKIKDYLLDPNFEAGEDALEWPLRHSFSDGIYSRELTIPEGGLLIGKIHKHKHHNFLLKGEIIIITEDGGIETLEAPCTVVSNPGTQRIGYAITETVWATVHLNESNTQDLELLEKENVVCTDVEYLHYTESLKQIKH